jgi:hypothetical protein
MLENAWQGILMLQVEMHGIQKVRSPQHQMITKANYLPAALAALHLLFQNLGCCEGMRLSRLFEAH